jgi:6-phosphogluconolactonase
MKFLASLAMAALVLDAAAAAPDKMLVFIGTYTGGPSKGIYTYELNLEDGMMRELGLAAEAQSPSFLAIHPNRKFLYAVSEVSSFGGKKTGAVSAFKMDGASGKLTKLNDASAGGSGPCYLVVDKAGKNVLVANYGGGSVAVLPIKADGTVGEATAFIQHTGSSVNPQRQKEPHAHSINLDAANRYAFVADLGLDKIMIYRFDPEKGSLTPNDPPFAKVPPGGGPRHFAFRPNGKNAYVCNEMTSTVTAFSYDASKGTLTELQTISTLPQDSTGNNNSTAEIQVHPSGKFVYCSNRGHNSVAVFSADTDGKLTHVENESTRGKTPRNFGIDPTGKYLIAANQDSDTLAVFRIDQSTGALESVGQPVASPKPVCVKFLAP